MSAIDIAGRAAVKTSSASRPLRTGSSAATRHENLAAVLGGDFWERWG